MANKRWNQTNRLAAAGVAVVLIVPSVRWGCGVSADLAALKQRVEAVERGLAAHDEELEEQDDRLDAVEIDAARTGGGR